MFKTKKEYIRYIKAELVMEAYLNGWLIKWYENKLAELLK